MIVSVKSPDFAYCAVVMEGVNICESHEKGTQELCVLFFHFFRSLKLFQNQS